MTHHPRRHGRPRATGLAALCVVAAALVPTPASALAGTGPSDQITYTPCTGIGAPAECGRITVPLDRADPAARTTQVAFALVEHRDRTLPSEGTIAFNLGGPGLTSLESPGQYLTEFGPLLDRRDLLLVDIRGTGASDQLDCPNLTASLAFADEAAFTAAVGACGRSEGAAAADYGTDEIAADLDDLRAGLGIDKLDLWGESYGGYLMQVYAALYPQHVRSIVLNGPVPVGFNPWGVDQAAAARTAIGLVCADNDNACQASTVLDKLQRLSAQLDRDPVHFTAQLGTQRFPAVLDQDTLADLVQNSGNTLSQYAQLPAALTSALAGDDAPLEEMVTEEDSPTAYVLAGSSTASALADPALLYATTCHDYDRAFSYAAPESVRAAQYQQGLAAQSPAAFYPFSAAAWNQTGIVGTAYCLDWPDEPTTPSPIPPGTRMPDVPTLVMAGDLDTVAPTGFGRQVAAEFPDSRLVVVPDAGHVPTDTSICALSLGLTFVSTLSTGGQTCAGTGTAPALTGVEPLTAAGITPVAGTGAGAGTGGTAAQRQAVGLVLATAADLTNQDAVLQLWGSASGLRGGTYMVQPDGSIALDAVKVVDDASISGTVTLNDSGGGTGTLTLSGPGVQNGTLTVTVTTPGHGQAVGTLAGMPVNIAF
jgi:pimeloyl-ACP methyl ester carboxylesterase